MSRDGKAGDQRWMVIGEVAGAFGVRGEIKVNLRTDFPERFATLEAVYAGTGRRRYALVSARSHGGQMLVRLDGVESPEAAARMSGQELAVPRDEAVELPDGHFFLDDMLGASVLTTEGNRIGEVTDILRTGSNDVFVVRRGPGEVLIPSTRDAIEELDVAGHRIVVRSWVLESPV